MQEIPEWLRDEIARMQTASDVFSYRNLLPVGSREYDDKSDHHSSRYFRWKKIGTEAFINTEITQINNSKKAQNEWLLTRVKHISEKTGYPANVVKKILQSYFDEFDDDNV